MSTCKLEDTSNGNGSLRQAVTQMRWQAGETQGSGLVVEECEEHRVTGMEGIWLRENSCRPGRSQAEKEGTKTRSEVSQGRGYRPVSVTVNDSPNWAKNQGLQTTLWLSEHLKTQLSGLTSWGLVCIVYVWMAGRLQGSGGGKASVNISPFEKKSHKDFTSN